MCGFIILTTCFDTNESQWSSSTAAIYICNNTRPDPRGCSLRGHLDTLELVQQQQGIMGKPSAVTVVITDNRQQSNFRPPTVSPSCKVRHDLVSLIESSVVYPSSDIMPTLGYVLNNSSSRFISVSHIFQRSLVSRSFEQNNKPTRGTESLANLGSQ